MIVNKIKERMVVESRSKQGKKGVKLGVNGSSAPGQHIPNNINFLMYGNWFFFSDESAEQNSKHFQYLFWGVKRLENSC